MSRRAVWPAGHSGMTGIQPHELGRMSRCPHPVCCAAEIEALPPGSAAAAAAACALVAAREIRPRAVDAANLRPAALLHEDDHALQPGWVTAAPAAAPFLQ
eukprot:CAMPEP_0170285986 /NCGR_PEP_ID=MMETSP0116_2-20130129/43047_1 /TAXON_ID=400756 /ORGANISM="Durinskia baltica, Strain CSIRO CS-38" /LENGTH=100 /DNA_ID=CAMNT_0010537397 /DNA_START=24 /DNA_END=327 /DNA_ORIENTATION=-